MKKKEYHENSELQKNMNAIKKDIGLLKEYDKLIKKVKELKENKG